MTFPKLFCFSVRRFSRFCEVVARRLFTRSGTSAMDRRPASKCSGIRLIELCEFSILKPGPCGCSQAALRGEGHRPWRRGSACCGRHVYKVGYATPLRHCWPWLVCQRWINPRPSTPTTQSRFPRCSWTPFSEVDGQQPVPSGVRSWTECVLLVRRAARRSCASTDGWCFSEGSQTQAQLPGFFSIQRCSSGKRSLSEGCSRQTPLEILSTWHAHSQLRRP